ncbi:MAG: hypothetical protein K6G24_13430 [Lachnospiraceae bacterium]|nr:hypothetical protein [Lachnospiraceae bacterium]
MLTLMMMIMFFAVFGRLIGFAFRFYVKILNRSGHILTVIAGLYIQIHEKNGARVAVVLGAWAMAAPYAHGKRAIAYARFALAGYAPLR